MEQIENTEQPQVNLSAPSGLDVRGDTGRTASLLDPWSTNGTFVWLTSDRAEIHKRGDELAFEPPQGCGPLTREAICSLIVSAVNNHAALKEALRNLIACDDYARETHTIGYAQGSPVARHWKAARSALAAATAKGSE